jgi:hypothetical protein
MNDDNGIDWRFIPTRSRILIVVGIVLFVAMAACGLPSHCAGYCALPVCGTFAVTCAPAG